jgi:hypothetical protein
MKNRLFLISILYTLNITIFLIPIVFLEGIFAYFLFKKSYQLELKFWYPLVIFLVANILSSLVGFLLMFVLPYGSKNITPVFHLLLIPAYLASALVEIPLVYLFIRKKTTEAWKISSVTSLLANLISYFLIFLLMTTGSLL